MDLLDKTYGSTRPKAQLTRNQEAYRRLDSGDLKPGELYALVTGAPAPPPPDKATNPVMVTGKRTTCLDCHSDLNWAGEPLGSQPRRCLVCGRLRRKAHNDKQAQKHRKQEATPESEQEADDLLQDLAS